VFYGNYIDLKISFLCTICKFLIRYLCYPFLYCNVLIYHASFYRIFVSFLNMLFETDSLFMCASELSESLLKYFIVNDLK
jgi:hypothetical protein